MADKQRHSRNGHATMPSDISNHLGFFDRLASAVARFTARAWFFSACMALVVIWAPSFVLFDIDTWQLIINTATTIITFLLVALLQNTETRSDAAVQHKLNAIADALADLMVHMSDEEKNGLNQQVIELRDAVGLEDEESA
ncbi:MAG TPA: low affinity iron permease family protein [Glycomyces sp.]|nr:low affinity iron permease family protein [Glycomyces sp.]